LRRIFIAALVTATACHAQVSYKVLLTGEGGGRIVELSAEKYVAAVLAGESSTFRSDEALKAMAVAARTYAARSRGRHAADGYDFCATTHCQRIDLHGITAKLESAAQGTAGELLWFQGKPALTVYTRNCGGETESLRYVWPDLEAPYLKSQADPYCTRHGASAWSWPARPREIVAALQAARLSTPDDLERIVISERTESNRANRLGLIGQDRQIPISASSFRFAIGRKLGWNTLRSDRYEIENGLDRIVFRGTGQGHGVGICQDGAEQMGIEGHTYREILAFYYPGAVISQLGAGLEWQPMSGERVTVLSTDPHRDRAVFTAAEAVAREIRARLNWTTPAVKIRVYPDLDTFRNATAEPGWVAAHTSGLTIDLQPLATLNARGILRETLRHELLHVAIEQQAAPGLPVWFREGLVEFLEGARPGPVSGSAFISDADFEQRRDKPRAEAAYAEACARVRALANRHGEAAVLGWVTRGLPPEVKNSTKSSPPANSK
jgi:stage II sporulation protein D